MKTKTKSHLSPLFPISLLALVPSLVFGAGLAAIKDQTFHSDAGANIVVYSELRDSGPFVTIKTAKRTFNIGRQKLAGKIEVLSAFPANITNDTELEPVRKAVKEYRAFSTRFPKSASILKPHIIALDSCIKEFEGGKARYNGKWITKEEALAAKLKVKQSIDEEEAAIRRKREDRLAFEKSRLEFKKSQKAKGLVNYNGKWIPVDEARKLAIEVQEKAKEQAAAKARAKQIAESTRRIEGIVVSVTQGGLLVDSNDYSSVVASSSASVGGGGNVYIPPDPNGKGRPARAEGVFLITGHPKQKALVDKDGIDVDAIEDGVYEYTSVIGAARRVKKYRVLKTYE